MEIDLKGRVHNLRLGPRQALHPVFEAVSNSIHAIADASTEKPRIRITFERAKGDPKLLDDQEKEPVSSVHIEDNGIGFTDENLESFRRSDTTYKAPRGGKGVGRLSWLKAFDEARVTSSIQIAPEEWVRREFVFSLEHDGVGGLKQTNGGGPRRTRVSLGGLKPKFSRHYPQSVEVTAGRIVEHFYQQMFLHGCPQIILKDGGDEIDLRTVFKEQYAEHAEDETFRVGNEELVIYHVRNYRAGKERGHYVHLCAHNRTVSREKAKTLFGQVPAGRISDPSRNGEAFWYAALVSGTALDAAVTAERDALEFAEDDGFVFDGGISKSALNAAVGERISAHLMADLDKLREETQERIETYVKTTAPQYRPLLKHRESEVRSLPLDLDGDREIERELHKLNFEAEAELRKRGAALSALEVNSVEDMAEYRESYLRFIEEENDFGTSSLARYVVHRKVVLQLLDRFMGLADDGKYELEEVVHRVICPLRVTSDDSGFEKHNLWIIDDRLAFHEFFASDKPLSATPANTTSGKEPDIVVFDKSLGFRESESSDSVTIIEFKRPERADYTDEKNPIEQVYGYIREIRAGRAKDERGRTVHATESTQFIAYVIATLTPRLRERAENAALLRTPDGRGYFAFNPTLNAYIEVLDYAKVLADSKKRNAVLFRRLGLEG